MPILTWNVGPTRKLTSADDNLRSIFNNANYYDYEVLTKIKMQTLRFLTSKQVQRLHISWINPHGPLSQPGMLESAVHSPINLEHYSRQQNPFHLAADLSEKVMRNHAYMDGNKRTALVAADMFMKINGYRLLLDEEDLFAVNGELADAQVTVVTGGWSRERLGRYFESRWF